jgi:hypothetical protein
MGTDAYQNWLSASGVTPHSSRTAPGLLANSSAAHVASAFAARYAHPPAVSAPAASSSSSCSSCCSSSASLPASATASRVAPASAPALELLGAPSSWMARAFCTVACCCSTRLASPVVTARTPASGEGPAVQRHTPARVSSCCGGLREQTTACAAVGGSCAAEASHGCSWQAQLGQQQQAVQLHSCITHAQLSGAAAAATCDGCCCHDGRQLVHRVRRLRPSRAQQGSSRLQLLPGAAGVGSAVAESGALLVAACGAHSKAYTVGGASGGQMYMSNMAIVTAQQLPRTTPLPASHSQRARSVGQWSSWHQWPHLRHGQGCCHQSLKPVKVWVAMPRRRECCAGAPLPRQLACGCWARCPGSCTGLGTPARPPGRRLPWYALRLRQRSR